MKAFKRNIVILTVLMFVCVAVYLNWSYNRGQKNSRDKVETLPEKTAPAEESTEQQPDTDAGLFYESKETMSEPEKEDESESYFSSARLSREQARDSAIAILEETAANEAASQEVIDSALGEIAAMASYTMTESQIENVLLAKGFNDCVVFLSGEGVNVMVPSPLEGLSNASVARITDVVTSESGLSPELIKIIEVK